MDATADELAGVVDLFGGLTRAELERALSEAAFRADGRSVDGAAVDDAIEEAVESFALVRYENENGGDGGGDGNEARNADGDREPLYVAGPTAFPTVPEYAEDVPHILDVDRRDIDREALGDAVRDRFVAALESAVDDSGENPDRIRELLDVSYDVEAWAPVDLSAERTRLEEALD
ncbi:DUF7109 family protein [Halobiforma nitratireducens]|uniref:Uncharacterized protein n=1 Tax=Halobiforma nitratireducens JCM 10879 TaxID=1227454 RepID=M0M7K3_9EURY|nr:hypothetical protein [Halobiforma nitratireducens]EMA41797.1 hypothetical protein C446_05760 [Halobiforma nitratireducens JCM 10879]